MSANIVALTPGDSLLSTAPHIPLDSLTIDEWGSVAAFLTTRTVEEQYIQTIDTNCAIFIFPSPVQMQEYRSMLDSSEADERTMDDMYYRYLAQQELDSLRVKTIVSERRFLRLKGRKEWLLDTHKKNLFFSKLILFSMEKKPMIADIAIEADEIAEYFDLKFDKLP